MHKCLDTLTELVQGNASMGNSRLLLQKKTITVAARLVELATLPSHDEPPASGEGGGAGNGGAGHGGSDGGASIARALLEMRASAMILLNALLEGSSREAEERMLQVLLFSPLHSPFHS